MQRVPPVATPVSATDMAIALSREWLATIGTAPSEDAIRVLVAHWALETGWGKECFNYNVGNAKARPNGSRDWCYRPCDERVDDAGMMRLMSRGGPRTDGDGPNAVLDLDDSTPGRLHVWLYPDHPDCCFRAFASLGVGVADHFAMLRSRFAKAWSAVEAGDPGAFVERLGELGYFTAGVDRYRAGVVGCFRMISRA